MTKAKYKVELKAVLDDLLLPLSGVCNGMVFGLPCYKVGTVTFATLYDEGVGIKLHPDRVCCLLEQTGFVSFRPFGRNRGKEFVQINHDNPEDYRSDLMLFEESVQYVLASSSTNRLNATAEMLSKSDNEEDRFRSIAERLIHEDHDIMLGKMMSSPAIQYQGKVFAFFHNKKMVFKLGRDFLPGSLGISEYSLLAPFKTKSAMADWYEIPAVYQQQWEELARFALQQLIGVKRGNG